MNDKLRKCLQCGHFLMTLIIFIGCTNGSDELAEQAPLDAGNELAEASTSDAGDELAEQAPPDAGDELIELVPLNVDCYGLGLAPGGPRKVTVAYQDCDDKSYFGADQIALLAKLLIDVWIEQELPEVGRLREHLNQFMFVAVHYDEIGSTSAELARLKFPDLYATDPDAAVEKLGDGDAFCFPHGNEHYDVSSDYSFFCVVASTILSEGWADVVLHEIGHAALWAVYGDSDPDHGRDDFWLGHAELTVMSAVLSRY